MLHIDVTFRTRRRVEEEPLITLILSNALSPGKRVLNQAIKTARFNTAPNLAMCSRCSHYTWSLDKLAGNDLSPNEKKKKKSLLCFASIDPSRYFAWHEFLYLSGNVTTPWSLQRGR